MREELKRIRRSIARELQETDYSEEALLMHIDRALTEWGRSQGLSLKTKENYRKQLLDSFRGMDILQPLLEDDTVTEIMVNGTKSIFVEKGNEILLWDRTFAGREALDDVIQVMAASVNRLVNTASPIADLRLADGSRVNIVLPPAAPDGPVVTIRKFFKDPLTMEKLLALETLTPACAAFLESAVICGCNIFISGGTGSGKTTFLNALSAFIPAEERVITIEDSLELQLQGLPDLVRMETRDPNLEGAGRISVRDPDSAPHAAGPHRGGGSPRRGGIGYAAGHEYRTPRLPVYRPRQQCGSHAVPSGNDGIDGRGTPPDGHPQSDSIGP